MNFAAIRFASFLLLSLASALASAAEITLYEEEGYAGRRFSTRTPFGNLGDAAFNNVAASAM